MNTETTLGISKKKRTWWIKYDVSNNKILGVSTKEIQPSKKFNVIESSSDICRDISRGRTRLRDCGLVWDFENECWDIDYKSDTLVLQEFSSRLYKIEENTPFSSDCHLRLYKEDGILEMSVNYENIKKHLNLSNISSIVKDDNTLFNLYFTHRNDPDYLILSVSVDPMTLMRRRKVRLDVSSIVSSADWNNISIFTRPILHKYTIEYLDKEIRSDYVLNKNTVLQRADATHGAHVTVSAKKRRAVVNNFIEPSQEYVVANQKDLKFLVCDGTIDNIVGAFGVTTDDLYKYKTFECDLDFDWPVSPIVVYKNKYLSVKLIGDTHG